jgi:SAM-dependent methyltransferase
MNTPINVSARAFEYLRLQKGSLDKWADDFPDWRERYEDDLQRTFSQIKPYVPPNKFDGQPLRVLDVGSGLGGIDVLIRRSYEHNTPVELHLLDGLADPPRMHLHRQTFNDMGVALEFQVANGLERDAFRAWGPDVRTFGDARFDLVVSFGSWCFHYSPSVYLRQVYRALAPGAVVILDVRTHKPEWMRALELAFELVTMVELKPKFSRCVFRARPL